MKTLLRFLVGFVVSFTTTIILWELLKLGLENMGNFGQSQITRNIAAFGMGIFFSIGYCGFLYYMANDKIKTTLYKKTVFISTLCIAFILLARALCFNYDKNFSLRLIWFTVGYLGACIRWLLSKPEKNLNNLTDLQINKCSKYKS